MNNRFVYKIAKSAEEAKQSVELGFEHVTGKYYDGGKTFRKGKLLYARDGENIDAEDSGIGPENGA